MNTLTSTRTHTLADRNDPAPLDLSETITPSLESKVFIDAERALKQSQIRPLRQNVSLEIKDSAICLQGELDSFYLKQCAQEAVRPCANKFGFDIKNYINVH